MPKFPLLAYFVEKLTVYSISVIFIEFESAKLLFLYSQFTGEISKFQRRGVFQHNTLRSRTSFA